MGVAVRKLTILRLLGNVRFGLSMKDWPICSWYLQYSKKENSQDFHKNIVSYLDSP
jgi:hypothetical protein